MRNIKCECGAKYSVREEKYPFADKYTITCDICGNDLIKVNGTTDYDLTLLNKEEMEKPKVKTLEENKKIVYKPFKNF